MNPVTLKQLITARKAAKTARDHAQRRLIPDEAILQDELILKLTGFLPERSLDSLRRCGHEEIFRTCKECGTVKQFYYACSLKWCPRCNWKISRRRATLLKEWSKEVRDPKHIVTTQRNFSILTRGKIRQHTIARAKLRRSKVWKQVTGGCVSCEITNEGNGWHLHDHWFVDARYVDMKELAITWGKLVGQEFGIVRYTDCRERDYCNEVCKYVVKPEQMCNWPSEQILEFVKAITGQRFFFQFGSLFKSGPAIRDRIKNSQPSKRVCACGCGEFIYETEESAVFHEIQRTG